MDIVRAIEKIDHTASYRLSHANATSAAEIVEWRGPGEKPTQEQLQAAWAAVQIEDQQQADKQQAKAADTSALANRIATGRAWIANAQTNLDTALTAGADGYTAAEVRATLDLLMTNQKTSLEIMDKLLAFLNHQVT